MPPVWAQARLSSGETTAVAMRRVPVPGLADGRDDSPQYENAADLVVLGGLLDRH